MRGWFTWGAVAIGTAVIGFWSQQRCVDETSILFEPPVRHLESAPVCPWRDPERDLPTFFPTATERVFEKHILSSHRVELTKLLGRPPEPEENLLHQYRICAGSENLGYILTRRVKGEHGAIELVLALNCKGEVQGVSFQRMREPELIANELRNRSWVDEFREPSLSSADKANDLAGISQEARGSALAIKEGVKSLLALHAMAKGNIN